MNATLIKAGASWTPACPASSPVIDLVVESARYGIDGGALRLTERIAAGMSGLRPRDQHVLADVCARPGERQVQDIQRRVVPMSLDGIHLEGGEPSAPATAHVNVRFVQSRCTKRGGSGPYSWRRTV